MAEASGWPSFFAGQRRCVVRIGGGDHWKDRDVTCDELERYNEFIFANGEERDDAAALSRDRSRS